MGINTEIFIHESDRTALKALKAIPGFSQLLKAFMGIWNEKQFKLINMSSNVRISDKQMKKYYDMLPPICEKLGIDVPELYVTLDPVANAYTSGENNPYIVITSGLIETIPDEMMPTVLAHECGHIACHHVLYFTMGRMILNGAISSLGLGQLLTTPIQIAFAYWMRCSEYSADRAAVLCDGTADKMIDVCMSLAGFDKDINIQANRDAFMEQALEYKELVNTSMWNKTLEFMLFNQISHPLTAVRALECSEWTKSKSYVNTCQYLEEEKVGIIHENVPLTKPISYYVGKKYQDVKSIFEEIGFKNINCKKVSEKGFLTKEGQVLNVSIGDIKESNNTEWFKANAPIEIVYYETVTEEEEQLAHPGQRKIINSSSFYIGKQYESVKEDLENIGFTNIIVERNDINKKSLFAKDRAVSKIIIDGNEKFDKETWFDVDAEIVLIYNVCK